MDKTEKNTSNNLSFCKTCGRFITGFDKCPYCRTPFSFAEIVPSDIPLQMTNPSKRSALKAGFLQIFLGAFGIGRFYLGYKTMGILQIITTIFTFGIGGFVWGLADGIFILCGKEKYDADGKRLF